MKLHLSSNVCDKDNNLQALLRNRILVAGHRYQFLYHRRLSSCHPKSFPCNGHTVDCPEVGSPWEIPLVIRKSKKRKIRKA